MTAPNDKISWCSRNVQICNNIDTLEGSFEIASVTAPFYLKKGVSLFQKGVSPIFKGCGKKYFMELHPLTSVTLSLFMSDGTSLLATTRDNRPLLLSNPLVALQGPHAICPLFLATPIFASPKDETLATPLPVAT